MSSKSNKQKGCKAQAGGLILLLALEGGGVCCGYGMGPSKRLLAAQGQTCCLSYFFMPRCNVNTCGLGVNCHLSDDVAEVSKVPQIKEELCPFSSLSLQDLEPSNCSTVICCLNEWKRDYFLRVVSTMKIF